MTAEVTAWMDAARAGDREAFGRLYVHYYRPVFSYIVTRVSRVHVAEDLTAEVFARALAGIDTFRWQGIDPGAWLVRIARNLVVDRARSATFQREILTADYANADLEGRLTVDTDPADVAIAAARESAVRLAIGRLPSVEQADAVRMRYIDRVPIAEVAAGTGRSETAVKALCCRGMTHLRRDRQLHRVVA